MSYKPKRLGHVNISVRNAERSRAWYEDLLGLHTYGFTPGRAAFMTSDLGNSHEVALVEVGEDAPGPQKGQVGLNHMAWYMDSLDDLKELVRREMEKGAFGVTSALIYSPAQYASTEELVALARAARRRASPPPRARASSSSAAPSSNTTRT